MFVSIYNWNQDIQVYETIQEIFCDINTYTKYRLWNWLWKELLVFERVFNPKTRQRRSSRTISQITAIRPARQRDHIYSSFQASSSIRNTYWSDYLIRVFLSIRYNSNSHYMNIFLT